MTATIRLAAERDVDALERLIPIAARALSVGFYTPAQINAAVAHVFGVDRQLIRDQTYFVAESDTGEIIGCGGWSKRATLFGGDGTEYRADDSVQLDPSRDPARIRAFFVHPDHARKGIGRAIVSACESAARYAGFKRIELIATLPGQPLYAAMGYAVIEPYDIEVKGFGVLPAMKMGKAIPIRRCS